jgi:Fe-S-cluster containining protein
MTIDRVGIESIFDNLSKSQMDYLHNISDNVSDQLKDFKKINQEKAALKQLHKIVDKNNEEFNKKGTMPVRCTKGCSHCCNIMVHSTQLEVDVIFDYMKEKKIKVSQKRLEEQTKLTVPTYFLSEHRRCVFLDDQGLCKVYPVRPMACRNYFVVTEPDLCDTTKYPHGETASIMNYETFAMHNGIADHYPLANFALLLLTTLKKKYGFFL